MFHIAQVPVHDAFLRCRVCRLTVIGCFHFRYDVDHHPEDDVNGNMFTSANPLAKIRFKHAQADSDALHRLVSNHVQTYDDLLRKYGDPNCPPSKDEGNLVHRPVF